MNKFGQQSLTKLKKLKNFLKKHPKLTLFIFVKTIIKIIIIIALIITLIPKETNEFNFNNLPLNHIITKYHITSKYIILVDFRKPSSEKRFYIIENSTKKIILETWVSHGINSGDLYATSFSNKINSKKSSLGIYITTTTYIGHNGLSMKIKGLSYGYNNNAEIRHVVIHEASYIGHGQTGRSWGCFAIPKSDMYKLLKLIPNQTSLIAYYPDSYLWT